MDLWGEKRRREELLARVGRLDQVAGVRLVTLEDGRGRGVRVLEFRAGGGFEFEVVVDRGFDLGRCEHAGVPLAWTSPVGIAGPWYREPDGFGFLRNFGGGLLTTAGLEHTLFPVEDEAGHFSYPPRQRESYGLHGRIANEPARILGYGERWDGEECVLWAEGLVEQAAAFGEHLALRRRIECRLGSHALSVEDEVTNLGGTPVPHMLLYHVNAGHPVLDEGSRLLAPVRAARARGGEEGPYDSFEAPASGRGEQVHELDLDPGADGRVPVALVNPRLGVGLYQRYRQAGLPHFFLWRVFAPHHYVVGIEPTSNDAGGRLEARRAGQLTVLEPGESRAYALELGALDGAAEIDAFAAEVERIREGAR